MPLTGFVYFWRPNCKGVVTRVSSLDLTRRKKKKKERKKKKKGRKKERRRKKNEGKRGDGWE